MTHKIKAYSTVGIPLLVDWFRDWSDQAFYIPVVYGQLAIPPVHQTAIMNAFGCGSHVHVRSKSPLKA
ncbi:hypothetical protein PCANC_10439 [Puccinia coronata f. sp. avenae]|uniref:Uncharacterized protein n=1 Tax=Puccinia coronata f. sp. avenae TaxID=200324 RepID=A0A2N5VI93_9BASI|nr:hypothetical protein PCANC_10439 [Puccinia coronata f. sp. avenae]